MDPAADAFRSTVELLSDASPRGVKQIFTFEFLIANAALLLLTGIYLRPVVDFVVNNQSLLQRSKWVFLVRQLLLRRTCHSKPIQIEVESMLSTEIHSTSQSDNPYFLLNVTQDILNRLNDKLPKSKDEISISNSEIENNIKQLTISMRTHGRPDKNKFFHGNYCTFCMG